MNIKKYNFINRIMTVLLAVGVGIAITFDSYLIALVLVIIGLAVARSLKAKVKDVLIDERDLAVAGNASIFAAAIYCWLAVIVSMVLYSLQDLNPRFESIAVTLSSSVLVILILQSLAARFNKFFFRPKKGWFIGLVATVILAIVTIIAIRFSLVGYWSCENGQWVKHNEPEVAMPTMPCPIKQR